MRDNKALEWLDNNELSYNIWEKKYRHNEESFDEWLNRISNNNEQLKGAIVAKKFIFGGRILASRGVTDRKVTYSNCYVIAPPEDNLESIFECGKKLARTYSYGGEHTAMLPHTVMCA
jgi:ribonucleoside-diphosphate reductase alpha chain